MRRREDDDFLAEPRPATPRSELPYMRRFCAVLTGFAAVMMIVVGAVHIARADDPRASAVVLSEPGRSKDCPNSTVSYSTPDGRKHVARMCAQSDRPGVGETVTIRYSADDPTAEVAPANESVLPIGLAAAGFFALGSVGLWLAWRRPETLLSLGLRPLGTHGTD